MCWILSLAQDLPHAQGSAKKKKMNWSSHRGSADTSLTRIHEDACLIPVLAQWVDLALLWLWCRPAAVAPMRPLAWDPPYATSAALSRQKKKRSR